LTADLNVKPDGLDSIGARTDCAKGDDHPDAAEQDRFVSGAELGDGTPRKDKLMQQAHIGPKPGAVSERPRIRRLAYTCRIPTFMHHA
jgi:hypothetical protein